MRKSKQSACAFESFSLKTITGPQKVNVGLGIEILSLISLKSLFFSFYIKALTSLFILVFPSLKELTC